MSRAPDLKAVNETDLRFLRWLATYCSPFGTEVASVSTVVGRLARRGLIARHDRQVALTGAGWSALFAAGYTPELP